MLCIYTSRDDIECNMRSFRVGRHLHQRFFRGSFDRNASFSVPLAYGPPRLLRSALFCPGDKERALAKACSLSGADRPDAVIIDLEDAVTPVNKALARRQVVQFLEARAGRGLPGPSIVVRVNCPSTTEWGEGDIKALVSLQQSAPRALQAIALPKVESHAVLDRTLQMHLEAGVSSSPPPALWAMVETPRGVLNSAVVAAHPSVDCLVFGANDLTKELRARHTADRAPLAFAMAQCVLAARAHGKLVLDGVHNSISNDAGLRRVCEQGRDMGFDGKSLIHPNQVAAAHAAFSPSPEEVAAAQRVLGAWETAVREGKSLAVVDGRLVEELHAMEAQRVVLTANMIANSLLPPPP